MTERAIQVDEGWSGDWRWVASAEASNGSARSHVNRTRTSPGLQSSPVSLLPTHEPGPSLTPTSTVDLLPNPNLTLHIPHIHLFCLFAFLSFAFYQNSNTQHQLNIASRPGRHHQIAQHSVLPGADTPLPLLAYQLSAFHCSILN